MCTVLQVIYILSSIDMLIEELQSSLPKVVIVKKLIRKYDCAMKLIYIIDHEMTNLCEICILLPFSLCR